MDLQTFMNYELLILMACKLSELWAQHDGHASFYELCATNINGPANFYEIWDPNY